MLITETKELSNSGGGGSAKMSNRHGAPSGGVASNPASSLSAQQVASLTQFCSYSNHGRGAIGARAKDKCVFSKSTPQGLR